MALNGNSACHWNVPNNFTGFTAQNTYSLWIFRFPNRSGYIYYLLEKFPLNFSSDINNAWISTSSSANNSCRNNNKYQGKILITWRQRRFCTHRREQLWINLRHASAIAVDGLAPAPFCLTDFFVFLLLLPLPFFRPMEKRLRTFSRPFIFSCCCDVHGRGGSRSFVNFQNATFTVALKGKRSEGD